MAVPEHVLHRLVQRLVELVHMPEGLVQLGNLCLLHPGSTIAHHWRAEILCLELKPAAAVDGDLVMVGSGKSKHADRHTATESMTVCS